MIWNLFPKVWLAQKDSSRTTTSSSSTVIAATTKRLSSFLNNNTNNNNIKISRGKFFISTSAKVKARTTMERARPNRRSNFRMRISRRMRAQFTPLPQNESDSDNVQDRSCHKENELGARKKDWGIVRRDRRKLAGGRRLLDGGASSEGDDNQTKQEDQARLTVGGRRSRNKNHNPYDVNFDEVTEFGFSFRKKRHSFGSESEKRRGERFQRREIERRITLDESENESSDSESHVCDFTCPLITSGECPKSQSGKGRRLKGQRRSSYTSSTSRESALSAVSAPARRLRPLASLSIDDLPGGYQGHDPNRSPGILSTASMWSTSDLQHHGACRPEADDASHVGTNSLSNVSGSFSERMHELVRAFSSRTQRAKEKISQPPTPSSDSDYDAKSAVSGTDEAQAPRNIRLGSFMGSRASDAFSDENHDHFVGVWHCKFKTPRFLKKLRFPSTIEAHSKMYVSWLFLVSLAFMYNAVVIPLRGVFPYQTPATLHYWLICDYLCDFIYILDCTLFKPRLRFTNHGVVECNRKETKQHYMKKWMFKFDVLSLLPLDLLFFIEEIGVNSWLRLPRILKIQTYWEFYERCDQASRSSAHLIRIFKTMMYMLFLIHIETCGYYAVSVYEGIGTNDWVYNGKGIAYIRCFYLATKTATSIGNNPKPTNELEYSFMTLYWLSGVFLFALLIGQIRDIVEAAGMVKDNYRKKMDSCLWYMQSINLPKEMKDRVREWFLYNWDQQKTIDERSLVVSLPKKLQTDLAINVHFNTLSKVQLFQDCERNLLYDLVLKLKPILYLPGDYICQKGEVGKEMYIVTQGQVEVVGGENNETVLATLHEGSVFGEISLLAMSGRGNRRTADVRCKGYTNVFTLSKHDFEMAMTEYPDAQAVLKKRAKKLLKANAKMEKKHKKVEAEEIIKTPPETPKLLQTVIQIMDPDSNVVKHLTPNVKRHRSFKRPHSRSHSHRLSPSTSNVHHLTPPRSHSFRLSSKPSTNSLNMSVSLDQSVQVEKDGFDTDDENDEPTFEESSDDVSLSEVLHDAEAISSFEDDDEDEELLIIEQYETDTEQDNEREPQGQRTETDLVEADKSREIYERKISEISNGGETSSIPDGHRSERSKDESIMPSEDSQDSGLPDVQRSDSRSSSGKKGNGKDSGSRRGSKTNSGNSGRNSGSSAGSEIQQPLGDYTEIENECENIKPKAKNGQNSKRNENPPLQHGDSMENYIEKQRWPAKNENKVFVQSSGEGNTVVNISSSKSDKKLAPPNLTLSDQDNVDGSGGRRRKLSVVSPPVSPISPRDKPQSPKWITSNTQTVSLKENGSDLIMRSFTPVETIPIQALPPTEPVRVRPPTDSNKGNKPKPPSDSVFKVKPSNESIKGGKPSNESIKGVKPPCASSKGAKSPSGDSSPHHIGGNTPSLTNGLEGCCGGGPLVDIPAENRVTCAAEIHRQMSVNSSTTDIHGHTETML